MPQAPRKDATSQRAQDKESKRARGALSCAECRRLKLKCDKTVPCSSCKRRGCSAICPNGSLITGQGTRFVLADTEKLHQKIAHMSDRIRQLEDALAILQSTVGKEPHPLLDRDLLKIKSSIELHSAVEGEEHESPDHQEQTEESQYIDAFGTLAIRDDGAATFYGRSAGSESLLIGEATSPLELGLQRNTNGIDWQTQPHSARSTTSPEITSLASTFPLASSLYRPGIDLEYLVSTYLPPWHQACRLCQLYLDQAPWFFGAVTQRQLHEEILPMWYNEAPKPPPDVSALATSTHSPSSSASPPMSARTNELGVKGGAHDLALLFVIFCFGALTDMELPAAPDNPEAEQYYQLTKASLTLEPILERPPSVATVQTLSLMAIYEGLRSGENSIESTWALMGLASKLAQSIGLHRDSARWKLSPAEVQKRRALFWELFITDCWQSLATGRLATFSLPFVDCELPSDPDQTMSDDGTPQPSFPFWKARFGAECVSAVVQGTLTSRAPKYSIILDLDRKVRDMELPSYAQGPPPQGLGLALTMSHFMPTNYRELTLLYIHRCFFAHAISSNPMDPIKSQYAPSFLAGYRSACTIIGSVKQQFSMFPAQIARFWVLWTHAFSATVMLASVVTHGSKSKVAPAALLELNSACDLFANAASYGGRAVKFLPILRRLQGKAQQVYRETTSGIAPKIPNDIFKPSEPEDSKDELSIFSGKTHTVSTKSVAAPNSNAPLRSSASRSSVHTSETTDSSRASSDSPKQAFTDNPSFAGVHPSLVNELNVFDGHIRAQIQNAYRAGGDLFGATPMSVDPLPRGPSLQQQRHQQDMARQQQIQLQQRQEQQRFQQQQHQQERERQEAERQQQILMQQQQQQHQAQIQQQQELLRQQQQQHQQHQQQQDELRRREQVQQQQRQEQYRLQVEEQQRQVQQQQHATAQQYGHSYRSPDRASYGQPSGSDHPMPPPAVPTSVSSSHHLRQVSQSQSHPNLQLAYQQHQQYQPMPHAIPSRHPAAPPPQHQMYAVPPAEFAHHPSPESARASPAHYTPPTTGNFDSRSRAAQPPHRAESYQYWPAAPSGYAMDEQPHSAGPSQPPAYQPHQHYTPGGALRGIAAEDSSLQETWQSYMHKVASPRHLFED